ncbi:MAG: ferredoxin, partial [Alphaproteobacteria bacterium]|nr:ferredoxin [Alphaproteobacteria bacterium]
MKQQTIIGLAAAGVVAGTIGAHSIAKTNDVPVVYFTRDISPAGLVRAYNALNWKPNGRVGIKMSTGESAKTNYLRPELIKDLVSIVDGTIVECNTAYGGNRSDSKSHWAAIRERGFLDVAPVDIMDEEGSMTLAVNGGNVLSENYV